MNYRIENNEKFGSKEVFFDSKPDEAIRSSLKALNFRWNQRRGCWYGFADDDAITAAVENFQPISGATTAPDGYHWENNGKSRFSGEYKHRLVKDDAPEGSAPAEVPAVPSVKFYYNGIRVDGGKLIKCGYSLDNNRDHLPEVSIYARDFCILPRDLFDVENDTDLYTDYFADDYTRLFPDHPLYNFARYAALKCDAKAAEKYIKYLGSELSGPRADLYPTRREYLESEKAAQLKKIEAFQAAQDPGQPSAADLLKIDRMNTEKQNAALEAKHAEELKQREEVLKARCDGHCLIDSVAADHPIKDGSPVVTIEWSEDPHFYSYEENSLKLSVPAADIILRIFDEDASHAAGYFKTSFLISYVDPESGEPSTYQGRYDLGDNDGGLIQHIRSFGEWHVTHSQFGQPINPDNPEDVESAKRGADIVRLAMWLENIA